MYVYDALLFKKGEYVVRPISLPTALAGYLRVSTLSYQVFSVMHNVPYAMYMHKGYNLPLMHACRQTVQSCTLVICLATRKHLQEPLTPPTLAPFL